MMQQEYGDEYGQEEMDPNQMDDQGGDGANALNLQWVIGFNKDIDQGVHFLTDETRTELFYSSAHTGVIYDYVSKTQKLL